LWLAAGGSGTPVVARQAIFKMKHDWIQRWLVAIGIAMLALPAAAASSDNFPVLIYTTNNPPPTPALTGLPLTNQITQWGITWTFALPAPVGRFVNGDYYVVGPVTVVDIEPPATNGYNGSMLNIQVNIQKSGFDSRIQDGRYNAALRVYPPILLTPGNKLVSSRSVVTNLPAVMRPIDLCVSPVASVSILTSVAAPLPPDAFRPSYAQGSTNIYLSRNLRRQLLPVLAPVQNVPPLSEFEGYLQRPWIDSVFFNYDVPSEYMVGYGLEGGYLMSFAGLLLTLNSPPDQKEPLLVYMVQYGIDLYGLVQQGHTGWPAWGGYGQGRKLPIVLAGIMLNQANMASVQSQFGEDMQTIWVIQTPPAGTYTKSWHTEPQTAVYGGHVGINGSSANPGWGPYEHLPPSAWTNTVGEQYRRCCTSVSWIGEALAARLIPGVQAAWNHPQFFAYADRWMFVPDDPKDLATMASAAGLSLDSDFYQGQVWKILSGGGYHKTYVNFVDLMWAAYRNVPEISAVTYLPGGSVSFTVQNLNPNTTNYIQVRTNLPAGAWASISTNVIGAWSTISTNPTGTNIIVSNFYAFRGLPSTNIKSFYRVLQLP
jgi:hypothetical protein